MKAMLIRTAKGLHGATEADHDAYCKFRRRLEAMKPGKWLRLEWATPRNGAQHRKLMALLQLVAENSESYPTVEQALPAVKLAAGYFDPAVDPRTGEVYPVLRSISFDKMEQDDFEVFYSAAIDGVLQVILPQMDRDMADRLMEMIVESWL